MSEKCCGRVAPKIFPGHWGWLPARGDERAQRRLDRRVANHLVIIGAGTWMAYASESAPARRDSSW